MYIAIPSASCVLFTEISRHELLRNGRPLPRLESQIMSDTVVRSCLFNALFPHILLQTSFIRPFSHTLNIANVADSIDISSRGLPVRKSVPAVVRVRCVLIVCLPVFFAIQPLVLLFSRSNIMLLIMSHTCY